MPQLILFDNGKGDFDMGSPIDYNRPIEMFDFAAFSEMINLVNSYGQASDCKYPYIPDSLKLERKA